MIQDDDREVTMDDLSFADYIHGYRFLKAYSARLNETMSMRSGDERDWCETVFDVTDGISKQIDDALKEHVTNAQFNSIIKSETWEGS